MGFLGQGTLSGDCQGALDKAVRAQHCGEGGRVCHNHKILAKYRVPVAHRQPLRSQHLPAKILGSLTVVREIESRGKSERECAHW